MKDIVVNTNNINTKTTTKTTTTTSSTNNDNNTNTTDIDKCSATIENTVKNQSINLLKNITTTTTTTDSLLDSKELIKAKTTTTTTRKVKSNILPENKNVCYNIINRKDDVSYVGTTATTVPKYQQQQQKQQQHVCNDSIATTSKSTVVATTTSSSSLIGSSPSALAKFNRIIDSTMPATDCYREQQQQRQQQQHKQQQHKTLENYPAAEFYDIVTKYDSGYNRKKIDSTSSTTTNYDDYDDSNVENTIGVYDNDDADDIYEDNQMKRNDVHYLLKQLNSFSDIEEIEIVDMKQTQRHKLHEHTTATEILENVEGQESSDVVAVTAIATVTSTTTDTIIPETSMSTAFSINMPIASNVTTTIFSPTSTSLVMTSPSSQSHKGLAFTRAGDSRDSAAGANVMRRYASLHQQQPAPAPTQQQQQQKNIVAALNLSGGNILADSSIDPNVQHQYLLQQFDDYMFESSHYLETNYFASTYRNGMIESNSHEFRMSRTTTTGSASRTSGIAASSEDADDMDQDAEVTSAAHSFELHEIELPSVICKAPPPPSPTRRFYATQARLTSCGVQTELTVSSLSTVGTEPSIEAKSSCSGSRSAGLSSASTSSGEQRRRTSFFRCCYMPIDRWREKRYAASSECKTRTSASPDGKKTSASTSKRSPYRDDKCQGSKSTSHKNNFNNDNGDGNAV